VRITAQLIRGATDQHLWAESYDRDLENVLVVLSEVAQAIAGEIEVALTPEQHKRLTSARAVSPEIQETYLKATFFFNRFTPDDVQKALALYRQTIDLDPTFAPAHAGLAGAEFLLGFIGVAPLDAAMARAEAAALRALELDPELAQAHTSLGWIRLFYYWDWTGAESEFRRALALNPNDPNARHGLADYMLVRGDLEESVRQVELGRQCDPLSPITIVPVVGHLVFADRYDEAIAEADKMLELFPEYRQIHSFRASALWHRGSYEEALAEYRKGRGGESVLSEAMEQAYRERGPRAAMRAGADFLAARYGTSRVDPLTVASYYAAAEEKDLAFEWLEKALDARIPQLLHLKADPDFDPLRSDPRFHDLLRRMKFPE
jgi:tetratricopeptide (TPR) repeat protein